MAVDVIPRELVESPLVGSLARQVFIATLRGSEAGQYQVRDEGGRPLGARTPSTASHRVGTECRSTFSDSVTCETGPEHIDEAFLRRLRVCSRSFGRTPQLGRVDDQRPDGILVTFISFSEKVAAAGLTPFADIPLLPPTSHRAICSSRLSR